MSTFNPGGPMLTEAEVDYADRSQGTGTMGQRGTLKKTGEGNRSGHAAQLEGSWQRRMEQGRAWWAVRAAISVGSG